MSAPNATSSPNTSTTLNAGCRAKVDDTSMNSLVNMPNGGSPAMAMTPSENTTASIGWVTEMPLMAAMRWVPLTWAMWPTEKKIPDLISECMVICSRPAKFASGPPMPNAKAAMPMCSIEE
jgi:hypothetical protein